jgi:two-component system, OmpR family, alkaline phosphatase synthesis response regulator PhoP
VERILVIHDDPGSQQTVRWILERAGYDVMFTAFDQIAIDTFRTKKATLVILDVNLPGKSTQDFCRQIREKSKSVSILVLSAISDVEEVVQLLKLGADDYMTKPFNPLEFLARVRAAIGRRGSQ